MSNDLENRGVEILNISVDIGNGHRDILKVFEHDDPRLIVRGFFIKNNITNKSEEALIYKVQEFIAEVVQEHQLVSMSLASRPNFPTSPCKNYGEKLYLRGLEEKEEKIVSEQMKRIIRAKEIECTLSPIPCINKKSRMIACKSASVSNLNSPKAEREKIEDFFSPILKKKSEKIAENSEIRTKELYEDAEVRKKKLEILKKNAKEYSFKPAILSKKKNSNPEEVVSRLLKSKRNSLDNIEAMRKFLSICVDPETGQKYFKPVIGKAPETYHRENNNVWESLYKPTRRSAETSIEYPYTPVTLEGKYQTEKILTKKKKSRFAELFQAFSPNASNEINYRRVKFSKISKKILKVMTPFLKDFEASNASLDMLNFTAQMENLLKSLTPLEKDILLNHTVLEKSLKETSSKTKISHKKTPSTASTASFYNRSIISQQQSQKKIEAAKKKIEKQELKECTFYPSTTKSRNSIKSIKFN